MCEKGTSGIIEDWFTNWTEKMGLTFTEMEGFMRGACIWGKTGCLLWGILGLRCLLDFEVDMLCRVQRCRSWVEV